MIQSQTEISKKVVEYLLIIPKGKVVTYKYLAQKFSLHPRSVAAILRSNTFQDVYLCYKVVMSDGKLGGYNLGGEEKIKRLKNDGIEIQNGKIDKKYFME